MRVALIGCGAMGSAMAKRLCLVHEVVLFDRDRQKAAHLAKELGVNFVKEIGAGLVATDVILLAIKPKDVEDLALMLAPLTTPSTLIVSMLAGMKIEVLNQLFPKQQLLRIMPNLAVLYEKGVIGIVETPVMTPEYRKKIENLFQGMGLLVFLHEDKIDALTALTGSSPAFVFYLIEAMMDGGVALGFPPDQVFALVLQVFEGAIALLKEGKERPAVLQAKVASPGGTTMEGLKVLESRQVHDALVDALHASFAKARAILE